LSLGNLIANSHYNTAEVMDLPGYIFYWKPS